MLQELRPCVYCHKFISVNNVGERCYTEPSTITHIHWADFSPSPVTITTINELSMTHGISANDEKLWEEQQLLFSTKMHQRLRPVLVNGQPGYLFHQWVVTIETRLVEEWKREQLNLLDYQEACIEALVEDPRGDMSRKSYMMVQFTDKEN